MASASAYDLITHRPYQSIFFYLAFAINAVWCLAIWALISLVKHLWKLVPQQALYRATVVVLLIGLVILDGKAAVLTGTGSNLLFLMATTMWLPFLVIMWTYVLVEFIRNRRRHR